MFEEVPTKPPYNKDPTKLAPQVRDYGHMLELFNAIMTRAPEFNETGLVGFPINAILDWPMGTPSSQLAPKDMPNFVENLVCDPAQPHRGFKSWDNFFTREFRPDKRPIAAPEDDRIIVNACESAPYRLATDVTALDRFGIKAQPYSLPHMLAGDALAPQFVGGTIYQAFLSALSYHRWHSPITGTVVKAYVHPGTYYSETPAVGFDDSAPIDSQGYIAEVATRAIIFIEADNPDIGLMCVMPVGMAEVSTCDITVFEGQHVKKGDRLGMFHIGGSTHCLISRPGVKLVWNIHGQTPGLEASNIEVKTHIALVQLKT